MLILKIFVVYIIILTYNMNSRDLCLLCYFEQDCIAMYNRIAKLFIISLNNIVTLLE